MGNQKTAGFFFNEKNGRAKKKRELEFDFPYASVEEVKFCMQTCKSQVGEGWGRVRVR